MQSALGRMEKDKDFTWKVGAGYKAILTAQIALIAGSSNVWALAALLSVVFVAYHVGKADSEYMQTALAITKLKRAIEECDEDGTE